MEKDLIYEDKIRKKFDAILNRYDFFLVNKGYSKNYFYAVFMYKGNIPAMQPLVIIIYLDTKTNKIDDIEIRRYLAEDIYLNGYVNEEGLYKFLEE